MRINFELFRIIKSELVSLITSCPSLPNPACITKRLFSQWLRKENTRLALDVSVVPEVFFLLSPQTELSRLRKRSQRAGMAPPTNATRVRFQDSASCGLSLLLVLVLAPRGFSLGTPVSPLLKHQHFQIPI